MQSHESQPSIILVLAGLLVLTAIEYIFSQMGAGLTLLLVLAFFKLLLVIIYFMHLPRLWTSPSTAEVEAEKDQE
jgi:heme/copper-type cytochrome/quinol oxidase subunit 4